MLYLIALYNLSNRAGANTIGKRLEDLIILEISSQQLLNPKFFNDRNCVCLLWGLCYHRAGVKLIDGLLNVSQNNNNILALKVEWGNGPC